MCSKPQIATGDQHDQGRCWPRGGSRSQEHAVVGPLAVLLFTLSTRLRELQQVLADRVHIFGAELVGRHDGAFGSALRIAEVLLQPVAVVPLANSVQRRTQFLADTGDLVAGVAMVVLIN